MYKSSGKLVYNPKTHLKTNPLSNEKWLVLMCDDQLAQYYRQLYHQEFFYRPKLQRPVWGTHISICRGEAIPNIDAWGFAANKIINFEYEPGVKNNQEYFWLKVRCDELCAIRELYGLPRQPQFGLHLTIGRV